MSQSVLTDAVLVDRVLAGFDGAFDELYRRHVDSAWRLAQAVTGNGHDAADAVSEAFAKVLQAVRSGRLEDGDAFRSYLLTATRNAGLDLLRRNGRLRTGADDQLDLVAAETAQPDEQLAGGESAAMLAEAFRALPERWRSVLWLTEVEGVATKEAADTLGLTANGTAQLAVRARAGLRERFLQAHVRGTVPRDCRFAVDHLGAYVGGGISPRDLAKVDQHLAGCEPCRVRKDELEELGPTLRRAVLPIPLLLGAVTAGKVHAALTSGTTAGGFAALAADPPPAMRRLAGASAATVLALGLLALPFAGDSKTVSPKPERPATAEAATVDAPAVVLPTATLADSSASSAPAALTAPARVDGAGPALAPLAASAAPAPAPVGQQQPAAASTSAQPAGTPPPAAPVDLGAGANLAEHEAGVTVELSPAPAIGVQVDDRTIGTAPVVTPEEPGVVVQAGPLGRISLP